MFKKLAAKVRAWKRKREEHTIALATLQGMRVERYLIDPPDWYLDVTGITIKEMYMCSIPLHGGMSQVTVYETSVLKRAKKYLHLFEGPMQRVRTANFTK